MSSRGTTTWLATSPVTRTATACGGSSARRVPFAEIGCTKDYPGTWAEYRIYEGGYTQVMRRVGSPGAFDWAEQTPGLYEGVYRDYALGPLEHRCFTEQF